MHILIVILAFGINFIKRTLRRLMKCIVASVIVWLEEEIKMDLGFTMISVSHLDNGRLAWRS